MVAPKATRVEDSGAFGNSVRVWLGCVAFLVVVELYIVLIGGGLEKDPRIGLFAPLSIAVFGVAGLVGVWFSHRTGFPAAWDSRISIRHRLIYPILWGIGIGLALVAHDLVFHWTAAYRDIIGAPSFNALAPFPGPLLFYSGGAIIVEVFYRLLPIPLLLWLVSNLALRGRYRESVFWVLAALTSLIEPATQDLAALQRPGLERGGRYGLRHRLPLEFGASSDVPEIRIRRSDRDAYLHVCGLACDLRQLRLRVLNPGRDLVLVAPPCSSRGDSGLGRR